MEESPTRELQPPGASRPSLSFSFGMPSNGTSLFGNQAPAPASPSVAPSSPFSFGAQSSAAPNPFATAAKPEEPKPFSFTSAAPTPTTTAAPFSFGRSVSTGGEAPRPNTTGGFGGFGGGSTPTTTAAPFSFGNNPPPNPFGGPQPSSAPGSPSTFAQSSPFSFGAPLPTVSTAPFSFGSQPASPAATSSALPSTGGFGSTNGAAFGASSPSSPFSAPGQLAPSTSTGAPGGGALFTIGAAPTPALAGAARQIRKLPSRRPGGAKR
ncbi:hypothetical protein BKA70DRAFT_29493 [Coprinopsis sp. MPI-PUGE-AT-0042]|nr:hypothetical protein BKA70DRAFT_29493 [Coprinopsis sp. MPI-PUGE-AT-0042]